MKDILSVIVVEIKHNIRNLKSLSMMTLLPIMLMIILSNAFSDNFISSINDLQVLYTKPKNPTLSLVIIGFIESYSQNGVSFVETTAEKTLDLDNYVAHIESNENNNQIKFHSNGKYALEASIICANFQHYLQKVNQSSSTKIALPEQRQITDRDFISVVALDGKRQPRSTDYYGITILTMIIFYGMYPGTLSIKREKYTRAGLRLLCSPIKKYQLMIGKIIGAFTAAVIQIFMVVLFSLLILGVYWGKYPMIVLMILLMEALMSISIGVCMSLIFKNEIVMYTLLNFIPVLSTFLAGGFLKFNDKQVFFRVISNISPMKWINTALLDLIYADSFKYIPLTIMMMLIVITTMIFVSMHLFKKESIT